MGNIIEVNIGLLEQDAGIIEERLRKIKGDVNKLYEIMDQLNGMWEGMSKLIFLNKLEQDKDCIEELLGEAEKVALHMKEAVEIYRNCESAVSLEIDEICV
ncbi:MAG: hypothetical protein IKB07_11085 [Lachnospiraceae bacterium]|nr:hypothetical protein [Lachnospiraceae bacterium]